VLSLRFNHFCIFSYLSVQDKPVIEENHCVFSDNSGRNVVENDPNYVLDDHPIVWTNFVGFTKVETLTNGYFTWKRIVEGLFYCLFISVLSFKI
jgi:hypothetical protein